MLTKKNVYILQPWQVPTQQNPPTLSYYMQAPVYHPTSKKIFYFGGLVNNATTEQPVGTRNVSMSEALTFDTANGSWGTQSFTGDLIPSVRRSHTVTLRMSQSVKSTNILNYLYLSSAFRARYSIVWWYIKRSIE